jgi:GT2 family glycosyltransferase
MHGAPDVSLILVAHRSAALLPAAVSAFRRELSGGGWSGEVIVVEQSDDAAEVERVAACAPERLLVLRNRGYAAGVNAGIAAAGGGFLLVGNPDVELGSGALAALLNALDAGWDVVGPQFELAGFLFPPADRQTPGAELARRTALPGRNWAHHLRRELRRWWEVWSATGPLGQPSLSGALLAFRRELSHRVGPWDEDYFLYFEETDWLRRARRAGARLALVPAARAAHRWGHSAPPGQWLDRFASSRRRYFRRHFPVLGPLVLRVPEPPAPKPAHAEAAPGLGGDGWRWLLSPSRRGYPAALLSEGRSLETSLVSFTTDCGLPEATLLAWRPGDGSLAGPFRRPARP